MKKLFIAVLFVFGSIMHAADAPATTATHGGQQPQAQPQTPVVQATETKSSKLFEYVSACLAERPSGTNIQDLLSRFK